MVTNNKRVIVIVIAVAVLLLIPFIAMQFTDEVKWKPGDFIIAAILLLGTGLMCEVVLRTVKETGHRIAICLGILVLLVMIWIELAVGVFGTPFAGS